MDRDIDYDVKRYAPKRGGGAKKSPAPERPETHAGRPTGAAELSVSEILDFAEGSDN